MDERIQRLNGIAQQGDNDAFYNINREDVKLLEHINEDVKPSFVNKRNLDGYTPVDLALLNGHTEMVCQLLQHNVDLFRVKGRECMTLLLYVAKDDDLDLLDKFLSICPDSITNVTTQNETALYIALKNGKLNAFKLLVGSSP